MRSTRVTATLLRHPYPRSTSSAAHYVGLGKQSTKGTAVVPTLFVPYQGSVDLDPGMDGEDIRQAGTGPYVARTMKTAHDPSGGYGMAVRPSTFARTAAWFLGADSVATAGSLFDHTSTPSELVTLLTTEQAAGVNGDIIERFADTMLTKMSLSQSGNTDLMAAVSWESLLAAWQATAATPAYEVGVSGVSPGGPFRASEATYTIDGAGSQVVDSFTIDLEWKIDEIRLSQVRRENFLKLELTGTVKLKQLLDDTTRDEYRKVVYGSPTGTVPQRNFFQGGSLTVAYDNGLTTTNLRTLSLQFPAIDWKAIPYTQLNPDGGTMYIEREGTIRKLPASAFCTFLSRNADAAAY
jgi:hypothetical protein